MKHLYESILDNEEDVLDDNSSIKYDITEKKILKNTYIFFRREQSIKFKSLKIDGIGFMIEPWKDEEGEQRYSTYIFLAVDEFLNFPSKITAKKNKYLLIANQLIENHWDNLLYYSDMFGPLNNIKRKLIQVLNGIKGEDDWFYNACEMFKHAEWKNLDPHLPNYFGEIYQFLEILFQ